MLVGYEDTVKKYKVITKDHPYIENNQSDTKHICLIVEINKSKTLEINKLADKNENYVLLIKTIQISAFKMLIEALKEIFRDLVFRVSEKTDKQKATQLLKKLMKKRLTKQRPKNK
jgi:hypothetical protein